MRKNPYSEKGISDYPEFTLIPLNLEAIQREFIVPVIKEPVSVLFRDAVSAVFLEFPVKFRKQWQIREIRNHPDEDLLIWTLVRNLRRFASR